MPDKKAEKRRAILETYICNIVSCPFCVESYSLIVEFLEIRDAAKYKYYYAQVIMMERFSLKSQVKNEQIRLV